MTSRYKQLLTIISWQGGRGENSSRSTINIVDAERETEIDVSNMRRQHSACASVEGI